MGFLEDVVEGLKAEKKHISSRYFYDAIGDKLFQSIMKLPEYYLTNSEFEVLSGQAKDILESLGSGEKTFDLVEFGAGDGFKTKILIEKLLEAGAHMRYLPIDISADVLAGLKSDFAMRFPNLEIHPENAEYFEAVERINTTSSNPKLVLFLGSSIGNFNKEQASEFLKLLHTKLRSGDRVLIGFDLMKDPKVILSAYNDSQGVTSAFNLNLLTRINRELNADFQIEAFTHFPFYDPETGYAKSFLVSQKKQDVYIGKADCMFHFESGEVIHTEVSKKFSISEIESLVGVAGFNLMNHFFDCRHYYVNTLFEKI